MTKILNRIQLSDKMEIQVFVTSDGHGFGLFDQDSEQFVNGSIIRFSNGDTLGLAMVGAKKLRNKATH
jgi:hypothetical protein